MEKIILDNIEYSLIKNVNDGFNLEVITEKYTDFFAPFDYIVGDWAYGKLRLKGFCNKGNKIYKPFNDKQLIDKYINEKCAYGCKWFVLEKQILENK